MLSEHENMGELSLDGGYYVRDGCKIEFKLFPSIDAEGVIFFLPGTYDRSKGTVQFQRHSDYVDKFHCLMLDDPSINESIGWFQGSGGEWAAPLKLNHLKC